MKKEKQLFDFTKYGFKLIRDSDSFKVYRFIDSGVVVELRLLGDRIAMDFIENDKTLTPICNQYRFETNNQIKFLLLNGKAGIWIQSARKAIKAKERYDALCEKMDEFIAIRCKIQVIHS